MSTRVIAATTLIATMLGCGTEVGGEGCFSDGQTELDDTSIQPEGWEQTAVSALQALSLATYAEGNATIDGQSVPISLNLKLEAGEQLVTFPGLATPESGCVDWVVKAGTLDFDGAIEGSLPVTVTLRPDGHIYEQLSVEDAIARFPGTLPPSRADTYAVGLRLESDTWSGSVQWLLEDNDEGAFIEFEAGSVQ